MNYEESRVFVTVCNSAEVSNTQTIMNELLIICFEQFGNFPVFPRLINVEKH